MVLHPGWSFRLITILTLTAGTAFIMWLGEQITERGIGNGISLIIFAGIVARMPSALINTIQLIKTGELPFILVVFLAVVMVAVVGGHYFRGAGPAADPGTIRPPGGGPQNVWGPKHPLAAEG